MEPKDGDFVIFSAPPKEGEEFSQGLTSPIVLVLVLDFDCYWLGEPKAA
jgi:hypothetical protein